jgi:hypothetical protein
MLVRTAIVNSPAPGKSRSGKITSVLSKISISCTLNLTGDPSAAAFTPLATDQVGGTVTVGTLALGPLMNNGGPLIGAPGGQLVLPTEAELDTSITIDRGVTVSLANDERGFTRPDITATNPDIGAFEWQGVLPTNFTATADGHLASIWTVQAGNFSTATNVALGSAHVNVAVINGLTLADVSEQATVTVGAGTDSHAGLLARYSGGDSNSYLGALVNRNGIVTAEIWLNLDGTWTQLSSQPVLGLSPTASATLRFDVYGSSLELFVNGTLETSTFDSSLTSGQVGIRSSAGAVLDNYSVS